jgi:uncharacterized protein
MIEIFKDYQLKQTVDGDILLEGTVYYLNVAPKKSDSIEKWIAEEQLENHILNYHPNNNVLIIKFDNVVGYVNILGQRFDVRSIKLLDGLNGKEQFKVLLDEIVSISSRLTFSYKGSSFGLRKTSSSYNFNDLESFDYYYQLVYSYPKNNNLDALLSQCFKFPNSSLYQDVERVGVGKSKTIPPKYFALIGNFSTFSNTDESTSLGTSSFAEKICKVFGKRVLPNKVLNFVTKSTYNTKENQFLKYFLEEINTLCLRVLSTIHDSEIQSRAKKLQSYIFRILQNPFFKSVSPLRYLPGSSSVLLRKSGYREIYYHFIQSKLSFRPILDELKRTYHNSRLKNIAALYEMWSFFKVAENIFSGELIKETFNGKTLYNGSLIESYTWEGKNCRLSYNKSYTKANLGTYSVTLRPDISLEFGESLVLLDAKYKVNSRETEEDLLLRFVKVEDIHKMHTYLDAIPKAKASIVIYPGNQIIFYDRNGNTIKDTLDVLNVSGVGAIPCLPNNDTPLSDFLGNLSNLITKTN